MSKNPISKISNAFSTGGGGVNFDQHIQAMFLLLLLTDGFCPVMNEQIRKVCFQAKHLGYATDDLVVFTVRNKNEGKLLCQVKHSITATAKNSVFQEVISAAWYDFNKENFERERDRIAVVTAQISNSAQHSLRFLHAQAIGSADEREFFERIYTPVFCDEETRKMLDTIKCCISSANNSAPTDAEVWGFCKAFILLIFDMDCEESINRALSSSLINCRSSSDALLVWSRLVDYAGRCNQTAASIDRNNIDKRIQDLFFVENTVRIMPAPITEIDLFIPAIALIGAWKENNQYDCQIIEKISGMKYSEFEAKARNMICHNSEYLQLVNGSWNVQHKEELLDQCKDEFFDDCIERLFKAVNIVLAQSNKRVMSQTRFYISSGSEYDNSYELRRSLVKSICWVKINLPELSNCNKSKIEGHMIQLVRGLLEDADWTTWANLGDCLQDLAELAPAEYLDRVEWSALHKKQEMLNLFPNRESDFFSGNCYISELLWSLEILAWSPDYLIKSICTLGLLEALPYEETNWSNTPINSIVSILLPWYPQTLADIEKRKNALKSLKNDNADIFWAVLKKLLPDNTSSTTDNPKPRYMSLSIPEEIKVTNAEVQECYAYLLELAVETVCDDIEKQVDLTDQIRYMYEPTLIKYLGCLEEDIKDYTNDSAFSLWLKLREQLAFINPTQEMVIYKHLDRIKSLINNLEPKDIRLKYQELYLGNRVLFKENDYITAWERLEREKAIAVKEIFDHFGIEETELFGRSVNNFPDVASKLGQSLTSKELSGIIEASFLKKVSQEFAACCINSFICSKGAGGLSDTSLHNREKNFVLEILAKIPFSMELFEVIDKMFPDDSAYWEVAYMPFACRDDELEELKMIVNKLISCKRYVTAVNIVGRSKFDGKIDAESVYNLLRLAGTEKSFGSEKLDNYAIEKIIEWLQTQGEIDLEKQSDIEFIYLPVLNSYSKVHPNALYTRLSLYPDYFCSMLEMFFKKKSESDQKVELNEGLRERLFEILFRFKVTPGIDWDGSFDEEKFRSWMDYVKTWSRKNDRYEVAMHTVGSGLSYAELDECSLPEEAIIKELNEAENNELRRGYYLGVVNQRGVHSVDPEGKVEMKLAEDYMNRADTAESKGYSRYADILREIAEQYRQEADYNIALAGKNSVSPTQV